MAERRTGAKAGQPPVRWGALLALISVVGLLIAGGRQLQRAAPRHDTRLPLPTSSVAQVGGSFDWKPRLAFQYYGQGQQRGPDPEVMATRLNWLMMRYGAESVRREVLDLGFHKPILQYVKAFQIQGPGPYVNSQAKCRDDYTPLTSNVMWTGDFCKLVHPHESWFLHNGKGERIYNKERNWDGTTIYEYYMNPASKDFRAFWVDQIQRQKKANWKGFFLDNVAVDFNYLRTRGDNQDGTIAEFDTNGAWQEALIGLIDHIRVDFPGYPVWGNMIEAPTRADVWEPFLAHLDGFQEERFATNWAGQPPLSAEGWEAMLARTELALAQGKGVVLYGQGAKDDEERMRFALASYLLVTTADDRASFRYAATSAYDELWLYPEYDLNLGVPEGPRYQQSGQWVRDFQCARVIVDPQRQTGTIEPRDCQ